MKECILGANLEGQGWQSRLFTILLILILELRYPQKRGANRKRWGSFGSCSAWEGGKLNTLGKEEFAWETGGRGKLCRLTIKWTSSKIVVKDFPYTLRVLFTDCFKSTASQKKYISQELAFLSITLQCHEA